MTPDEHIVEARRLLSAATDRLQAAWEHPDVTDLQEHAVFDARRLIRQTRDVLAPATVTR